MTLHWFQILLHSSKTVLPGRMLPPFWPVFRKTSGVTGSDTIQSLPRLTQLVDHSTTIHDVLRLEDLRPCTSREGLPRNVGPASRTALQFISSCITNRPPANRSCTSARLCAGTQSLGKVNDLCIIVHVLMYGYVVALVNDI